MMKHKGLLILSLSALALPAWAQESEGPAMIEISDSQEYGSHLTDAEGNPLYLFVNEDMESQDQEMRMTEGIREAAASCTGGCLEAWPPVTAEEVQAGDGVDEELLYTEEVDGRMQAVYNGWPLYRYAEDEGGQIAGQGVGQDPQYWYIVSPDGRKVEQGAEQPA